VTRGRTSLVSRILAASCLLALLVAAAFGVLILAISSLRRANERETRSKDVTVASLELENVVISLQTALRGYIISGNTELLNSWDEARSQLPKTERRLTGLVASDKTQASRVQEIVRATNAYVSDYAVNVMRIASWDRQAAREEDATVEGRRQIEDIRSKFDEFLAAERARAQQRADSARTESSRAITLALTALGASAILILLFGLYLARWIARPVRRVATAASRVAAGDFATRLPEEGPGEIGGLTQAFNSMARSLEASRDELMAQNEALQASEHAKTELISIVSHELRTPLSSVLGFTKLLLERDFDETERRRYLGIVDTEARRLASLAEDFLDVQLLEEGKLELVLETLDAGALVREQVALFFGHGGEHKVDLRLPDEPLWVDVDPDRLSQVVGNLLANAIKYSPNGGDVEVRAETLRGDVRIVVRDSGLGIPREDQAHIFTKFFRGRAAASGIPGTGLGLAVARQIIEAHGGVIGFASEEGRGTTFWIELPAHRAASVRRDVA
jgi:signal transduction histidine kinase